MIQANYDEWLASPLDERRAMNAVAAANNMAAWAFKYWHHRDAAEVYRAKDEGPYRNELAVRECPDFALVRDVAEAHKHFELDRKKPLPDVTRADQTGPGSTGWGEGGFGEGVYGGGPKLVVTLHDGTKRALTAVMKNVIVMWEQLLTRWRL